MSKYNHGVHVLNFLAVIDQRLMVSNVSFESVVKSSRMRAFLVYSIFRVAQSIKPVSKYLELAGQVYGHDAENIVEAKVRYSNEVESHYLLKISILIQ